jgi:hypothetical protein
MAAITYKGFRGRVKRFSERLQAPNFATFARNIRITAGRVDPLRGPLTTHNSLAETIKTIWRYRYRAPNGSATDNWFVFPTDTNVVASLIADDADGRTFWTSDSHEPRMSTYAQAISGPGPFPAAWYALGIPSPTVAPTVAVSGGAIPVVTRGYAFTFATALGEESGPSPVSTLTAGNSSGTWDLSDIQTAPPNSGTVSAVANNTPSPGFVRVTLNSAFGLAAYDTLTLTDVVGMTDLNRSHRVVSKSGNNVVVALTTTQTYTSGGTWARNAPINTAGMVKRIYRTEGTNAAFLFVAEIPVVTTTYSDTTMVLTEEVLQTLGTLPPPKNLTCLTALSNGCLCGLADNELCFSDPYMPYSWPVGNRYSFVGHGVALCPTGNSVIVLTDGYPILFTGTDPEAMSQSAMETYAPCTSKRGVVNIGGGALYPSFDGLWLAAPAGCNNNTSKLYRQEEWKLLSPETFDACYHDGQYYAVHRPLGALADEIVVLDIAEMDSDVTLSERADALYRNEYDGEMYLAQGNQIKRWNADESNRYVSEWTSNETQLDQPRNFSWAQVHARYNDIVPPDNSILDANTVILAAGADAVGGYVLADEFLVQEILGSNLRDVPRVTERKVQFTLYAGDTPVFQRAVNSATPFRLPAGFKSEVVRIGVGASVGVYSVTIAESTSELAKASP